jgi:hypothetical protein
MLPDAMMAVAANIETIILFIFVSSFIFLIQGKAAHKKKLSIGSFLFKGGGQNRSVPPGYLFFLDGFQEGFRRRIVVSGACELLFFFSRALWGFAALVASSRAGVQIS